MSDKVDNNSTEGDKNSGSRKKRDTVILNGKEVDSRELKWLGFGSKEISDKLNRAVKSGKLEMDYVDHPVVKQLIPDKNIQNDK
ncbi:hypothetical protein SAMN05660420_01451 [Desulfuromusa kysingii]|uniref:Uncharacterized protein n=1 Tax=Desulfuromusa kysingii TaxID=37625 RepID=A0A1H3Z059_9BACT|nr:hypothetical protein [Desulfuromusa kysingii]SEA16704.1 hypothetical protein SAMN05660420_01451 [Desulfuromusa kysingii]